MQQSQSKTLQLEKCLVKHANFHAKKYSYGYNTLYFYELS